MTYMDFRKRLIEDSSFRVKYKGLETLDAVIEAAAREGYSFTADEVRNSTEILPEELAAATGGLKTREAFTPDVKIGFWNMV